MTAPWWPPAAPVARQRIGELTSRELAILIRFAESGMPQFADSGTPVGTDVAQLAEFLGSLRAEDAERRELHARIGVAARTGKRTLV